MIFDCGGGAVLDPENMANLRKNGLIIYLSASPEFIYENIKGRQHRPLLNVEDPQSKIAEILETRRPYYEKAVLLKPDSGLLRRALAQVQIELGDQSFLQPAIDNLLIAVAQDRTDGFSWHQLAIAYGRLGRIGESSLALAEVALLRGNPKEAKYHAGKAEKLFAQGTPEWLQAQDILSAIESAEKK